MGAELGGGEERKNEAADSAATEGVYMAVRMAELGRAEPLIRITRYAEVRESEGVGWVEGVERQGVTNLVINTR